jgi:hypothetical protein
MTRLTALPDYGSDVSTSIIVLYIRMHVKFYRICTFVYSVYIYITPHPLHLKKGAAGLAECLQQMLRRMVGHLVKGGGANFPTALA